MQIIVYHSKARKTMCGMGISYLIGMISLQNSNLTEQLYLNLIDIPLDVPPIEWYNKYINKR